MDVLKMTDLPPGLELDELVATKVMGIHISKASFEDAFFTEEGHQVVKPYSTSIEAAWQVVDKFKMTITRYVDDDFSAMIHGIQGAYSNAKSAPHAICLAALKATEK